MNFFFNRQKTKDAENDLLRQARSKIKQISDFLGALPEKNRPTPKEEACFTTTNEKTDGCSHTSASSAVGANPDSLNKVAGFTRTLEASSVSRQSRRGFTLVEVIVSIGIFTVVVTVAMVGLLSVLDASREARAQADAVDNLNFVVDDMIRRIRTGYTFECDGAGDCPNGASEFSFTSSEVDGGGAAPEVTYRLGENDNGNGQIQRRVGAGDMVAMTSPEIDVTNLTFFVTGTGTGDNEQSRAMILIEAEAGDGETLETFSLQTTVTQRLLFSP